METKKNKRNNLKKEDIVKNISEKIGIPVLYSTTIINDLIKILIIGLVEKKKIKIKNFGTFNLKKKDKRIGRNPRNNNKHMISERHVVTFKAAESLKKKININVKK